MLRQFSQVFLAPMEVKGTQRFPSPYGGIYSAGWGWRKWVMGRSPYWDEQCVSLQLKAAGWATGRMSGSHSLGSPDPVRAQVGRSESRGPVGAPTMEKNPSSLATDLICCPSLRTGSVQFLNSRGQQKSCILFPFVCALTLSHISFYFPELRCHCGHDKGERDNDANREVKFMLTE